MSHVIPLRLFQILNSRRWNCNVFGWSRKMTEGNYVRNLSGPGLPPSGAVAWPAGDTTPIRPARPLACLQSLSKRLHYGCPKMSHVIPLRLVQVLNSCRWNCNVFGWSRKMTALNYVRYLAGGGVVAAHGHRSLALLRPPDTPAPSTPVGSPFEIPEWFPNNVARNSPAIISNFEFTSLELQRFRVVSKNDRVKLRARFVWARSAALGRRGLARGRYDPDPPRTSSCLPSITFEAATSWLPKNVARNSPAIISNFEFTSLELQRFRMVSKNDRGKLRAKFGWRWCRCRPRAPQPGPRL